MRYTGDTCRTFEHIFLVRGGVAQWLEQRAHNLLVAGSNPATPTRKMRLSVPGSI